MAPQPSETRKCLVKPESLKTLSIRRHERLQDPISTAWQYHDTVPNVMKCEPLSCHPIYDYPNRDYTNRFLPMWSGRSRGPKRKLYLAERIVGKDSIIP